MKHYILLLATVIFIVGCNDNLPEQEPANVSPTVTSLPTTTLTAVVAEPPSTPTLNPLPSPEPLPGYIVGVSPQESITVPFNLYQSDLTHDKLILEGVRGEVFGFNNSICVALEFASIDLEYARASNERYVTEIIPFEERKERISVWLNDLPLTKLNKDLWWGPSGHTFCWEANADVGEHKVDFQLTITPEDIRTYSWYFAISGKSVPLATFTPLP